MKQNRMTRQPPEEIQPFLDTPFLKDFRGRDIIYTKDFYVAMYKKISEAVSYTHLPKDANQPNELTQI